MNYDKIYYKNKYRIPSARLDYWDYTNDGFYFITICTDKKKVYFGNIEGQMRLSHLGKIVKKLWVEIPAHYKNIKLDEFVIMPNHLHGIIILEKKTGDNNYDTKYKRKFGALQKNSIPLVINQFKRAVKIYCTENKINFSWQPRYFDRIIRNDDELNKIRQYILDNPLQWDIDRNNPKNL